MKVGIKKIHENEWQVIVGFTAIKMDHFSVELLNMTLEHLVALDSGKKHSILKSYISLGLRLNQIDDIGMQKLAREVESEDLLTLMQATKSSQLEKHIMKNVGINLAQQLQIDLKASSKVDVESTKEGIRRVIIKMFELEAKGEIEFSLTEATYI